MASNEHTPYPENRVAYPSQDQHLGAQQNLDGSDPSHFPPDSAALSQPDTSPLHDQLHDPLHDPHSPDAHLINEFEATHPSYPVVKQSKWLDKKWQRLYFIVPLAILAIVLAVLFEVYKSDFERWVSPLTNWLHKREAWSWVIPVVILFFLSFPPLFGHEIVQLIVGLTYPLGVAIGIACAGSILGEAGCFIVFKYRFTGWVDKKIAAKVRWAAIARIVQEAGYKGVLVIRYSIVPPHLANPLFACTGMKFWVYMSTVILSLPKSIIFVALGAPGSEHSKGVKYAKVIAVGVLVAITIFASRWIRAKMAIATKEIEAERGVFQPNGELDMWSHQEHDIHTTGTADTSYHGAATTTLLPHQNAGFTENRPYQGAAV